VSAALATRLPLARQVVWAGTWATSVARTIRIVVAGDDRVDLDAVLSLRDQP
jgi:hypothetical protein